MISLKDADGWGTADDADKFEKSVNCIIRGRPHGVFKGDRETLEACDADVAGLGRLVEREADAEFAFVEPQGLRADDRSTEPENTRRRRGIQTDAVGDVDLQKALDSQDADLAR